MSALRKAWQWELRAFGCSRESPASRRGCVQVKAVADGIGGHSLTWDVGRCSGLGPKESKMRSNAMTKITGCATGALLFGGTLGATQSASAGLVWVDQIEYTEGVYNYDTGEYDSGYHYTVVPHMSMQVSGRQRGTEGLPGSRSAGQGWSGTGSAVWDARSLSANPVSGPLDTFTVSKTATTATGFSVSSEFAPVGYQEEFVDLWLMQPFVVTAGTSVQIRLTVNAPNLLVAGQWVTGRGMIGLQTVVDGEGFGIPGYQLLVTPNWFRPNVTNSETIFTLTEGQYVFKMDYRLVAGAQTGTLLDFAIVPAPGAIALLGAAGLMGRRRRN